MLQSLKKRPLSPDVIDLDGKHPHYVFPWGALSSITNRVTGVALSVGKAALINCSRWGISPPLANGPFTVAYCLCT